MALKKPRLHISPTTNNRNELFTRSLIQAVVEVFITPFFTPGLIVVAIGNEVSTVRAYQKLIDALPADAGISLRATQNKNSFQRLITSLSRGFIEYLANTDRYLVKENSKRPEAKCMSCRAVHPVYDLIPFYEGYSNTQRCVGSGHQDSCSYVNRPPGTAFNNKSNEKNYENYLIRKATFFNLPGKPAVPENLIVNNNEMAIKGKYYKDRKVHCFGCNAQYDSTESILERHQHDQPDCRYSRIRLKGETPDFQKPPVHPDNRARPTLQSTPQGSRSQLRAVNARNNNPAPGLPQAAATPSPTRPEQTQAYQMSINMGFANHVVLAAFDQLKQTLPDIPIATGTFSELLIEKILSRDNQEDQQKKDPVGDKQPGVRQQPMACQAFPRRPAGSSANHQTKMMGYSKAPISPNSDQINKQQPNAGISEEIAELKHQLQEMEEEGLCKVCCEKEQNIVFDPCGHLATCKECAAACPICPICRKEITKQLRIFKS